MACLCEMNDDSLLANIKHRTLRSTCVFSLVDLPYMLTETLRKV